MKATHDPPLPTSLQVTERDYQMFRELACHRFLSAEQINRLLFQAAPRRVRRRLKILCDADFIRRVAVVAQPTRGIPSCVYQLTQRGAELISTDLGKAVTVPSATSRSLRFLTHHLGCVDVYVKLVEALRLRQESDNHAPYRLARWLPDWELKFPQARGAARAERVRLPDGNTYSFLPDAYFELHSANGRYLYFFELDNGTHPLGVWRQRARLYTQYGSSQPGLFRRRFGGGTRDNFRLLILCPRDYRGRSRCDNILRVIQETVGDTTMFLAATTPDLAAPPPRVIVHSTTRDRDKPFQATDAILGPIWRQIGTSRRCALLPTVHVR